MDIMIPYLPKTNRNELSRNELQIRRLEKDPRTRRLEDNEKVLPKDAFGESSQHKNQQNKQGENDHSEVDFAPTNHLETLDDKDEVELSEEATTTLKQKTPKDHAPKDKNTVETAAPSDNLVYDKQPAEPGEDLIQSDDDDHQLDVWV
ncbi:hypothetical protein [Flocculibacter collagenilyticus]|uniref:hypothetical protein n=1 Tax=Flocculibacter collagenilyticus TaxID=2744479 RepID=UPI0018F5A650|nr:hypothetical protein [Flocculibacter collagenilyticus]